MKEYKEFARYYDYFYNDKAYDTDINFLIGVLGSRTTVLDAGCGTGEHIKFLERNLFEVEGFDLNDEMLEITRSKVNCPVYQGNILDFQIDKKYDAVISMFGVFNYLKSYKEFEQAMLNLLSLIKDGGILVIDLHNGRQDGIKYDEHNGDLRTMEWTFDKKTFTEKTKITYRIDGNIYETGHDFLIYEIEKIEPILKKYKLKYNFFENYSMNEASEFSKNIELVIYL